MTSFPELLTGEITLEYGSLPDQRQTEENPTDTCGSDCSGGKECGDETCVQQQEQQIQARIFVPAVAGWNEPPDLLI